MSWSFADDAPIAIAHAREELIVDGERAARPAALASADAAVR